VSMRVGLTGSHGLIATALAARLRADGDTVVPLVRGAAGPGQIAWDPASGRLDPAALAGIDAVVNLAGAGIGDRRWSPARRAELQSSRIALTETLSAAVAAADPRPGVLLSGSAVGWYGDRGDEELTEASGPGTGFLADLCRRWEEATASAESAGVRVAHLRSGVVLARGGGALRRQLPLFRLGLGGPLGRGRQYLSWIALEDEVGAITYALRTPSVRGPLNLCAPRPGTSTEFARVLGRVLHRPARLPAPALALKVVLGAELTQEMLLAGQRAVPAALVAAGYAFALPELEAALRAVV
jgi:uncharacterized protein